MKSKVAGKNFMVDHFERIINNGVCCVSIFIVFCCWDCEAFQNYFHVVLCGYLGAENFTPVSHSLLQLCIPSRIIN